MAMADETSSPNNAASNATETDAAQKLPPGARDRSVSMAEANVYGLIAAVPPLAPAIGMFGLWAGWDRIPTALRSFFDRPWIWVPALIIGLVIHEFLHGITWSIFGRASKGKIQYGFQWKTLTPFAHCQIPIALGAYRIGTLAPAVILGVVPSIVGALRPSDLTAVFGWTMLLCAGGDFLILWLLRLDHRHDLVEDHPVRAGCLVIPKEPC